MSIPLHFSFLDTANGKKSRTYKFAALTGDIMAVVVASEETDFNRVNYFGSEPSKFSLQ